MFKSLSEEGVVGEFDLFATPCTRLATACTLYITHVPPAVTILCALTYMARCII